MGVLNLFTCSRQFLVKSEGKIVLLASVGRGFIFRQRLMKGRTLRVNAKGRYECQPLPGCGDHGWVDVIPDYVLPRWQMPDITKMRRLQLIV